MIRASIDIGSNSTLLLIGNVDNGQVCEVLENESRVTGLGRDLDLNKKFIQIAMDESVEALKEYSELIKKHNVPSENIIVTATEATRVAKNKDEFIRKQNDKMQEMQNQLDERIRSEEKALLEKQEQSNKAQQALRAHLESTNKQIDKINNYIRDFEKLYERKPESHEIQLHVEQNMKDEIETAVLDQFLFEYSV